MKKFIILSSAFIIIMVLMGAGCKSEVVTFDNSAEEQTNQPNEQKDQVDSDAMQLTPDDGTESGE